MRFDQCRIKTEIEYTITILTSNFGEINDIFPTSIINVYIGNIVQNVFINLLYTYLKLELR